MLASSRLWIVGIANVMLFAMACTAPPPAPDKPSPPMPISLAEARARFDEAKALCEADHGALWGVSLCGPMMVVDRATRFVVANQPDREGKLQAEAGVFVGALPADQNIANTAVTWAGVRWVQLGWPLPADAAVRGVMMTHEAFHRIADEVGTAQVSTPDNVHLATVDGRYYLQLEWAALAAALIAKAPEARRAAIADALAFRRARRAAFPGSAAREDALEMHEGLAEYTGVVVGHPAQRVPAALEDLTSHRDDESFVRSFAYATGPAYGLLLDQYAPGWRRSVAKAGSLSDMLAEHVAAPAVDVELAAARYAGPALRVREQARAERIAAELARYQRALVDGPVLRLAFVKMSIQFDPRNLQPLGELGTVYPNLRVVDAWGILEVTNGALIASDWSAVTVAAPPADAATAQLVVGEGWRLELAPGWHLAPGERAGDFQLRSRAADGGGR